MRRLLQGHTHLLSTASARCPSVSDEALIVSVPGAVVVGGEGTATDWTDSIATLWRHWDLKQTLLTEPAHNSNKMKKINFKLTY